MHNKNYVSRKVKTTNNLELGVICIFTKLIDTELLKYY